MSKSKTGKYIDKGLDNLIKSLGKLPYVKVGVLGGSDTTRENGGPTNATIGAAHEYGAMSRGLPQRSWLRMPINDYLPAELQTNKSKFKAAFRDAAFTGKLIPFMTRLAAAAERVCKKSFTNGGYGKWPQLTPKTMARKENKQILVETGQLMKSVMAQVVGGGK